MNAGVYSLNEATLAGFLSDCLRGRRPHLLAIEPLLPPFAGLLQRIADWSLRSGRARWAVELAPEWQDFWNYDRRFHFHEASKRYEPWQERHYDFAAAGRAGEPYAYGYKLIIANSLFPWLKQFHVANAIAGRDLRTRFHGLSADFLAMAADYLGADFRMGSVRPMPTPRRAMNLLITLSMMAAGLVAMLRRLRRRVTPEPVFFAGDYLGDNRDLALYAEMAEGGRVLVVARNAESQDAFARSPAAGIYRVVLTGDGHLLANDLPGCLALTFIDVFRLFRCFGRLPPHLYWRIAAMPVKRLLTRALFRRFPARFFWGRDDYNVEHVLRRPELHRVGGTSLGVCHAVPTNFCSLIAMWRYISFDIYYTAGNGLVRPYLDTWATDMTLRSAGSFGVSRADVRVDWPQGEAILIAARVAWNEPELPRLIRAAAQAFPDCEVLVQIKPGYVADSTAMVEGWIKDLPNVTHVAAPIYELLRRCKVLVSDVSTLIAESIQLGIPTYFADITPLEYSVFRELPGLARRNAEEVVEALADLESGRVAYPWLDYMKRMDLTPRVMIYDLVREDVGLPPVRSEQCQR